MSVCQEKCLGCHATEALESGLQRPEAPERCNVDGLRGVRAWHGIRMANGCGRMYSFVEGGWLKSLHR